MFRQLEYFIKTCLLFTNAFSLITILHFHKTFAKIKLQIYTVLLQWKIFKRIMLHFRAMILMSLNKELYSYHHKKVEAISFFKFVKKRQKQFINLHVHLLVEQRASYKDF